MAGTGASRGATQRGIAGSARAGTAGACATGLRELDIDFRSAQAVGLDSVRDLGGTGTWLPGKIAWRRAGLSEYRVGMIGVDLPDFGPYLHECAGDLEQLRQNWLTNEGVFLGFARGCGLPVGGVIRGEPGELVKRGLLDADAAGTDGEPWFHPFRLYPLSRLLETLRPTWRDVLSDEELRAWARYWDSITDLAVILEPVYWPRLVGTERMSLGSEKAYRMRHDAYRARVTKLVQELDAGAWQKVHECLRLEAASMDGNSSLYLLLRVSKWHERKQLRGPISGALWIRHMAEVIRRAFEEVHAQRWHEEDEAFGLWSTHGRVIAFGAARPLDDVMMAKTFLAREFGLFTGSTLRWYVEGHTEYFALLEVVEDIARFGVELVNLQGGIASGKNNAPLKLEAMLKQDRYLRRFSMLSLDGDVPENVKFVREQVRQGHIVGMITVHNPDWEFANFTCAELVEVAAGIDENNGFPGDAVRRANWDGITTSRAFEAKYLEASARRPGKLKDEQWGRALACWADRTPERPNGEPRPLWKELRAALHSWSSNYESQREDFTFDPETFSSIPRTKGVS